MLPKDHIVLHVNDVHRVIGIVLLQELQDLELHASLIVVLLLVLNDLKRDELLALVVKALDCYAEGAFAKELLDLVAVANVIFHIDSVVALVVVEAKVVVTALGGLDFLATKTHIVNLREVENLLDLESCQVLAKVLEDFLRAKWILEVFKSFDRVCRALVRKLALDLRVPRRRKNF